MGAGASYDVADTGVGDAGIAGSVLSPLFLVGGGTAAFFLGAVGGGIFFLVDGSAIAVFKDRAVSLYCC